MFHIKANRVSNLQLNGVELSCGTVLGAEPAGYNHNQHKKTKRTIPTISSNALIHSHATAVDVGVKEGDKNRDDERVAMAAIDDDEDLDDFFSSLE